MSAKRVNAPVEYEMIDAHDSAVTKRVGLALREGKLAVIPTDTVYGLAAHPGRPDAESRLFDAKGRDRNKPIALLAAGIDDVRTFGACLTPVDEALAARYWPGPLTLILPVPRSDGETRTEGFRVPNHPVALAILRAAGGVLRVTSANASGRSPALTAKGSVDALAPYVDIVVNAGRVCGGVASTVVQISNNQAIVLREGAVAGHEISSCLEDSVALRRKAR
jgi:L-threonylcarbamoyladenylate synthase